MEDFQEKLGVPACALAACLDASFGFVGAHEVEGEAANNGHIFGAVAGPVSRQIVFELDVKQPVHGFDTPVATGGCGDALDVEGRGGDIEACVEAAAVGIFYARVNLDQGVDGGEAGLARIAAVGCDPVDVAGSRIGSRLDAAMSLLDGSFGDEFVGGSGAEIVLDIGFEGRLVALEGEQVVGLMGDDLVGDPDLAAHGVDRDQRTFELAGFGEFVEKVRDGGDLVGLLRNADLRQRQTGGCGVGAQRMQGLETFTAIMGATCRFAVDGDEIMPIWPQRCHPTCKAAPEQGRTDPIDEATQPALARNTMMEVGEMPQKVEVFLAPGDNIVEVIAPCDRGARHQQQDLTQGIGDTPGLAVVLEFGKMAQKQGQPRPRHLPVKSRIQNLRHGRLVAESRRPRNHSCCVNTKLCPKAR